MQLKKWISSIPPEDYRGSQGDFASYIIAPDGKKAGFWYSFQSSTVIKFSGSNRIEVYPPELNQPLGELEEMITPEEPEMEIDIYD